MERSTEPSSLVRIDSELEDSIEFQHEMVRQVTYESMVEKVRENIHARILAAFESDETWSDGPDTLCYHAMRAKDWLKAFGYGRGGRAEMSCALGICRCGRLFRDRDEFARQNTDDSFAGGRCN
ncbi:hypothetical protein BRDID11002_20490 [Bradyrhizobium diazoefficiens]